MTLGSNIMITRMLVRKTATLACTLHMDVHQQYVIVNEVNKNKHIITFHQVPDLQDLDLHINYCCSDDRK